jgi:predicted amidohydrolase YtcJ/pimeloyl-ACP methyl ester carboxylesterase
MKTVVFITGAFVSSDCWNEWKTYFERQGYATLVPPWPYKDAPACTLRQRHPDPDVAGQRLADLTAYFAGILAALPSRPILVGHSMGGLITQLLIQQGLAVAGIAIHSLQPQGIFTFKFSFYKAGWGALGFFTNVRKTYLMSFREWQYAFTNGMPYEAQKDGYYNLLTPESKLLVRDATTTAAKVDFDKPHAPLLFVAGSADRFIPASLNYKNCRKYKRGADYKEFTGRNHFVLGQPGWEEVAGYIVSWLSKVLVLLLLCLNVAAQHPADLIIYNGKIATMVKPGEFKQAIAIQNGLVLATGDSKNIMHDYNAVKKIDAGGRTIIPGLNDSHMHAIREGLNYNMELRWDGVKTLKRAMEMLKEQAARTPDGVWVKVVGGWNEFQFEEKRQPTLEEINAAVPDKPVFITYLYGKAFLNKKGVEVLGYDERTNYPGSLIEFHKDGALLYAKETPMAIYRTLALTGRLTPEERINSSAHFYREINRFGITSVLDAAGGSQNYDADYQASLALAKSGRLTVRTGYYLFAQQKGKELEDYEKWMQPGNILKADGYAMEGAGEQLIASGADFENFLEPRIELPANMEADLEPVIKLLVKNRWPFRLHATYGESIDRMLTVFEKVNKEIPFNGLRWFFDHAETITPAELARVKALGGGVAVQYRMYYQGELYTKLYGQPSTQIPPVKKMLEMGIPVGMGTDAPRISTYNPWMAMHWLLTGKTIGGMQFWPVDQVLDKYTALQLYTIGSAWCSGEQSVKGQLAKGWYADLAMLSDDYFTVEDVRPLHALMTVVNGKIVYAAGPYAAECPPLEEAVPVWSPVRYYKTF